LADYFDLWDEFLAMSHRRAFFAKRFLCTVFVFTVLQAEQMVVSDVCPALTDQGKAALNQLTFASSLSRLTC